MIEIYIDYKGDLHCEAKHGPSQQLLETDAPVDNNGRGESFSPTDLLAASLGTCMATVLGIAARRKEISLEGMNVQVRKFMSDDQPRRVSRLEVDIYVPISEDHVDRRLLQSTALGCPVHHSIHPDIEVAINWFWSPDAHPGAH